MKEIKAHEKLKTPGVLGTLFGIGVLALKSRGRKSGVALPHMIGSYTLVSSVNKKDNASTMGIGVYQHDGKRVIIKRWEGKIKDFAYYMLVNEYLLNELLSKKIASYASNYTFPNSIEYFKDATSFSAVFEFVDGTLLTTYPLEKQAEVVAGAIDFISKISSGLSIDERSRFVQRPFSYYLFLLPIITVASALADIRNAGTIFSVAGSALSTAPQLARTLALAHRDITPDNIMIAGESAYILDTENMVLTLPGYDYAYLCATPDHQELVQMLPARFVTRNSAFLQKYITLHHILGSGEFLKVNSRYVDLLRKLRT